MIGKIVQIIEKIVRGINNNFSMEQVEKSILREYQKDRNTVAAAFSWIYEKMLRDLYIEKELDKKTTLSLRILSDDEKFEIGLENYNYLLHFHNIGMLKINEFNSIIEQFLILPEGMTTKENINILILSLFLEMDNHELPGSRNLLYSSDTIN